MLLGMICTRQCSLGQQNCSVNVRIISGDKTQLAFLCSSYHSPVRDSSHPVTACLSNLAPSIRRFLSWCPLQRGAISSLEAWMGWLCSIAIWLGCAIGSYAWDVCFIYEKKCRPYNFCLRLKWPNSNNPPIIWQC